MVSVFRSVPIEVLQMIAKEIEYDEDVLRFSMTSRETYGAIYGDNGSFWRKRFHAIYEARSHVPQGQPLQVNQWYRNEYRYRRAILRQGADFTRRGMCREERCCLEVLRDLVCDSWNDPVPGIETIPNDKLSLESKNQALLSTFLDSFDLLRKVFNPWNDDDDDEWDEKAQLYYALVVVFTDKALPDKACYQFPESQQIAYTSRHDIPMFVESSLSSLMIDMELFAHIANFWRCHLSRPSECTLHRAFAALSEQDKPQSWRKKIVNGPTKLGKHWKGSYAFVESGEMEAVRRGDNQDYPVIDNMNVESGDDGFQDFELSFAEPGEEFPWPEFFEKQLKSLAAPIKRAKTRSELRKLNSKEVPVGRHSFRLEGTCWDNKLNFYASGWINALPPQQGIPGWQRLTMMKYFKGSNGVIDMTDLWAYEGVVIPGGQIILGRWWHPRDDGLDISSGPFILWNVDDGVGIESRRGL